MCHELLFRLSNNEAQTAVLRCVDTDIPLNLAGAKFVGAHFPRILQSDHSITLETEFLNPEEKISAANLRLDCNVYEPLNATHYDERSKHTAMLGSYGVDFVPTNKKIALNCRNLECDRRVASTEASKYDFTVCNLTVSKDDYLRYSFFHLPVFKDGGI